jgi:hypothetical protein
MQGAYQLIDKKNVAVTRPALEGANWRCQSCRDDENLRVIDQRGVVRVLCDQCRLRLGSPTVFGRPSQ